MAFKYSAQSAAQRQVNRNLVALDEAVALFRKTGKESWANDIADVRDFIARSKAYYDRLNNKHSRRAPDARELAEAMWSDIARRK